MFGQIGIALRTTIVLVAVWPDMPDAHALQNIITRLHWGGRQPNSRTYIPDRVSYIIMHHSYIPDACYTPLECSKAVRAMQRMHMDQNGWDDIGYNFAIGGDGKVYEGRGFGIQGAHSPGYNNKSLGIVLIGNWMDMAPTTQMISTAKDLIWHAISKGYLSPDYDLYGHRQVRAGTECPGDALFGLIQNWAHWKRTAV